MSDERRVRIHSSDGTEDLGIGIHLGKTTLREDREAGEIEVSLQGIAATFADLPISKIRLA
jgi:hypothetical protein